MKTLVKTISFAALVAFSATCFAGLTGKQVMEKIRDREKSKDSQGKITMTLVDKNGDQRKRSITVFNKNYGSDSKNVMYFSEPADVKGTGFLQENSEDESKEVKMIYLPALKKVRRITGSSKNESFMGSDFTYDDMGKRAVDADEHTLLKEEPCEGQKCWIVESKPKDKSHPYSKVTTWIRQDALIPIKADIYDKQGNLLKVMVAKEIRKQKGFWTAFNSTMENVQEKHKTILKVDSIDYNVGLKDDLFTVKTIEKGYMK